MFAHIYKAKGGKWVLILSLTPAISSPHTEYTFNTRREAKLKARSLGAVAHNYIP
jgi:hypothetical protein